MGPATGFAHGAGEVAADNDLFRNDAGATLTVAGAAADWQTLFANSYVNDGTIAVTQGIFTMFSPEDSSPERNHTSGTGRYVVSAGATLAFADLGTHTFSSGARF